MEDINKKIEQLTEELNSSGRGAGKIKIREKLVEYAQISGDEELEYTHRKRLVYECYFEWYIDKMLIHFSWLMAYFNKYKETLDSDRISEIMSEYTHVLGTVQEISTITKGQFLNIYQEYIDNVQVYTPDRINIAYYWSWKGFVAVGDHKMAEELRDKWRPHLDFSDFMSLDECDTCVLNHDVKALYLRGDYDKTIELGNEVIANDEVIGCSIVPCAIHSRLAEIYLYKGDEKQAREHFDKFTKTKEERTFCTIYKVHAQDYVGALKDMEHLLNKTSFQNSHWDALDNYFICYLLFEKLKEVQQDITIRLPEELSIYSPNHKYKTAKLASFFLERSIQVIKAFDKRNGNTYISDFYSRRGKAIGISV